MKNLLNLPHFNIIGRINVLHPFLDVGHIVF
jgi:hypothetical protein